MENKIGHAEMKTLPFIVCLDFDGTLVGDAFPKIGKKNELLFAEALRWQSMGIALILWTCRDNDNGTSNLDDAVEYCKSHGLVFDAVNKNHPAVIAMFNNDTRKVYANLYVDDKNLKPSVVEVFRNWDPREFKPWHSKRQ